MDQQGPQIDAQKFINNLKQQSAQVVADLMQELAGVKTMYEDALEKIAALEEFIANQTQPEPPRGEPDPAVPAPPDAAPKKRAAA